MDAPALELRHVIKRYGLFTAVDDLSLAVPAGGICGFLGPNGAGKTTTLRMILEILRPTSGSISVLGSPSALRVRERIGYLPEEKGLYKKMKAWSLIAYFATLKGMAQRAAKRKAFELLERYGLKDFAEAKTETLSKGMSQKVQVLASIAHDPDLVIFDEPFSGLDPVNQQVLEELIREMTSKRRTVIFSTHVMEHAERLCDRLVLINRGRKIFEGTVADARRRLPPRLVVATPECIDSLRGLESVREVRELAAPAAVGIGVAPSRVYEFLLQDTADPQKILQACFEQRIALTRFEQLTPTLHDVFVALVGPEGREARFR